MQSIRHETYTGQSPEPLLLFDWGAVVELLVLMLDTNEKLIVGTALIRFETLGLSNLT